MSGTAQTSDHLRPHFFIIGERKCGTSSLYRYLLEHPQVLPGPRKEMQFFTKTEAEIEQGFTDYLRAFPRTDFAGQECLKWPELDASGKLYEEEVMFSRQARSSYCTGEASADTLSNGQPGLLKRYLPELRLIVILRDPCERAFSHHRMLRRFQAEGRELGFVVGDFVDDMHVELALQRDGKSSECLSPGLYLQNLQRWNDVWSDRPPLVLFTEDLQETHRCAALMERVLTHLGLPAFDLSKSLLRRYNQAPEATVPQGIRAELQAFYDPHNRALADALALPLPWI